MTIDVLLRVAEILRRQPGGAMPARKLYHRLVSEVGDEAGSYVDMCRILKNRPQSFMLLDPPSKAVLATAGMEVEAQVALVENDANPGTAVGLAGQTVTSLWNVARQDEDLLLFLSGALEQLVEIGALMDGGEAARPTIRLPGPRR